MANISAELAAILAAVKGEDVRGSIHDSIDLINRISEVVLSTGTAVTSASSPSGDYFDKSLYLNTDTKELWKCNGTGLGWTSLGELKGDNGNGIASIEKTATSGLIDTYTITYDDDTTSEFYITNGEGNKWYRGTDISGKSTSPAQFTLPYAVRPGDNYINTSSSETEQGAIYHCTQGAEEDEASSWVYDFTLTGGGGSEIDIINALTSTRIDAALSANMGHALKEFIDNLETDKVDKVPGYGLSKNDYSDAEKTKVSNAIQNPSSEGTSGQVLTTDGEGGRSWEDAPQGGHTLDTSTSTVENTSSENQHVPSSYVLKQYANRLTYCVESTLAANTNEITIPASGNEPIFEDNDATFEFMYEPNGTDTYPMSVVEAQITTTVGQGKVKLTFGKAPTVNTQIRVDVTKYREVD